MTLWPLPRAVVNWSQELGPTQVPSSAPPMVSRVGAAAGTTAVCTGGYCLNTATLVYEEEVLTECIFFMNAFLTRPRHPEGRMHSL